MSTAALEQPPRHLEAGQARASGRRASPDPGSCSSITSQRLDAVGRLADDLDAADLPEQEAQLLPRQLLVVDDDGAQMLGCPAQAVILAGTTSSGITIRAQVPSPGTLSSCSW